MAPGQRQIRVRKLGKNTPQQVLREDEIDPAEYKSLLSQTIQIESGVEKSEEKVSPIYLRSLFHGHMT